MDSTRLHELIQSDLDGALSTAERAELARLLLQEPEARRLHAQFGRLDRLLRDIPLAEPPAGLRAAILAEPAMSPRGGSLQRAQHGWPLYGVAAAVLGGMAILGIGYVLFDDRAPGAGLQGSVVAAGGMGTIASRDRWTFQAEGIEASASLRREGEGLRLELKLSTAMACEAIAAFDPATTSLVGMPVGTLLNPVSGQVVIPLEAGTGVYVLDFSRAAPIELQLHADGRLLAQGTLSTVAP
jgi:anti-sigma factor RsiW